MSNQNHSQVFEEFQKAYINLMNLPKDGEAYDKFMTLYTEMKKLGLIKKHEYNVPLIDTIGRKLHEDLKKSERREMEQLNKRR